MSDPFQISGPALVSFSGGRTSALMLRRILDVGLADDVHICFANTGKERKETLDFVHEIETRWNVPVRWLEYRTPTEFRLVKKKGPNFGKRKYKPKWVEVTYQTASRLGEPFDQLVIFRGRLPNRSQRICTSELKIRPMREFMKEQGYRHWTNVIGLRADEPRRLANQRALNDAAKERWTSTMPLADAGITEVEVMAFWRASSFDLGLRTWEGNCDLCFLKTVNKRVRILQDRPGLAAWWIDREGKNVAEHGEPFCRNMPAYPTLLDTARRAPGLIVIDDELSSLDCTCTD